ncbi:hypothetical protein BD626DRAFT_491413 [Schizophyllum amplum]|uniref:BHLH domain-containing protein n=1 Tax=Schizophyllum amplum TaxID=97359 RepID=A0A550CHM3_9AGAR|nr:hypothetical protein BD626DRAFT_491413 [Auriculariopsis ampla]
MNGDPFFQPWGSTDPHAVPPPPKDREALTQATKDLMSLADAGASLSDPMYRSGYRPRIPMAHAHTDHPILQKIQQMQHHPPPPQLSHQFSYPLQTSGAGPSHTHPHSTSFPPSQFSGAYGNVHDPPPPTRPSPTGGEAPGPRKRQRRSPPDVPSSTYTSLSPEPPVPAAPKTRAASGKRKPKAQKSRAGAVAGPPKGDAALLTPSQKKANHIQSEQKRRANIRRGYEALCETVPALREAIAAEEQAAAREGKKDSKKEGSTRSKSKIIDGEKIDGRAGPRSENVVLAKTIDYINGLLDERQSLLTRLHRARSVLGVPPDQTNGTALWERQWNGGEGRDPYADEDDEEGAESDS